MRLTHPLLLVFALAALPASAADQTAPSQTPKQTSAPTLQVYSRETIVDVTVTDSKGNPVRGLTQSDFTILEEGKPQTIRSFKESGAPVARPLPVLPPGVYSNVEAAPESGPVYVFLLDALNTSPAKMVFVKQALLKYIKGMPQGVQVAVFGLSLSKGGRMLQGFTADHARLAATVSVFDVDNMRHPVDPAVPAQMTLQAFQQIAGYVGGIKGRKNLLWFTASMPIHILRDGGYDQDPTPPWSLTFKDISDLYDELTGEQIAIYPMDPSGVANNPSISVVPGAPRMSDSAFLVGVGSYQLLMERVAEQTGGSAFYNNNDLDTVMGKAIDHGGHYYTLTYVPPPFPNDTRYHPIDIKVDRPGLHLVYRKGYNAVAPTNAAPAPGAHLMQAAMAGGAPPATQLLFDVKVQLSDEPDNPFDPPVLGLLDPRLKKLPLTRYSFLYLVPVSQIAFADAGDQVHSGSLEFDVAAYDADGRFVTLRSQTMKLPLTKEEYDSFLKTPFQFLQQIDLPPGPVTLRVGILDGVSNKVGTLEVSLTVPKAPSPAVAGGP